MKIAPLVWIYLGYLLGMIFFALVIRVVLCYFKALAIRQGEADTEEDKFHNLTRKAAFSKSFWSNGGHRNIDDYWLPFIVGLTELCVYPFLMVGGQWKVIGFWIGIKSASQWGSWQKSRTPYNRFLLGNILGLFFSYFSLIQIITK